MFRVLLWLKFVYAPILNDLVYVIGSFSRGRPEKDGAFLLGPGANIKNELYNDIKTKQFYKHSYHIIGGDNSLIPCDLYNTQIDYKIKTNNIYIYSYSTQDTFKICRLVDELDQNDLEIIQRSVSIPFYIKWLGYKKLHFELFGNYLNFSNYTLQNKMLNFPTGSTLVVTAAIDHNGIRLVSDELISKTHTSTLHENNPYFRYIKYLLHNPDNNLMFVKLKSDIRFFLANITELSDFSNIGILTWQQIQIERFVNFFLEIINYVHNREDLEFKKFIKKYILDFNRDKNFAESITIFQEQNLFRYKEILLFNLISKNQIEKIKNILNHNVDVNCVIRDGVTPLHVATALGREKVVKTLLDFKANVDAATNTKLTALMESSKKNFITIVELLLNNNANPNAKDIDGHTPLTLAALFCRYEIVELLLNNGAELNDANKFGENAFTYAIKKENFAIVRLLLSYAPNLKSPEYISCYQNNEIMHNIKSEIAKFEANSVHYVIQNNHDMYRTNNALNNIKSYNNSENYIEYIDYIQNCLSKFELNKSYNKTLEICINSINEEDSLNLDYTLLC